MTVFHEMVNYTIFRSFIVKSASSKLLIGRLRYSLFDEFSDLLKLSVSVKKTQNDQKLFRLQSVTPL